MEKTEKVFNHLQKIEARQKWTRVKWPENQMYIPLQNSTVARNVKLRAEEASVHAN